MITSNSGHDLRTPVDFYVFKCSAKQCSLEAIVTAPHCPACAFSVISHPIQGFYFWLLLRFCRPYFDTVLMYCRLSNIQHPFHNLQTNIFYFLDFFSSFLSFLRAWSLGTRTVFLWLLALMKYFGCVFIKFVLSWRINAVGNSHPSCLHDTHVAFIFIGILC